MDEAILQQRLRDMTLSPPNTRYVMHTCNSDNIMYILYWVIYYIFVLVGHDYITVSQMVGGCGFVTVVNVTTSLDNRVLYIIRNKP